MTVITLVAGKEHIVKVGAKERKITVRPGEVRYEPFLREASDIPIVKPVVLPEKDRTPVKPSVTPPRKPVTYEEWSRARPTPSVEDIIDMVEGVRGKGDMGFKPTFSNLVSLLKKYRK